MSLAGPACSCRRWWVGFRCTTSPTGLSPFQMDSMSILSGIKLSFFEGSNKITRLCSPLVMGQARTSRFTQALASSPPTFTLWAKYHGNRWHCAIPWPKATRPTWRSCQRQGEAFLHKATHVWSSQELALVSLDSSNTSRCRCAIALNSRCEPTRKNTTQPLHQQRQQRPICLKRRERSLWSEQQLDKRQDKALRPSLWRNLHLLASWLQFLLNIWFWYLAKKGWRAVCLLCKNGSLWISRFEAMHCNVVPVENAICWSLIYFSNQNLLKIYFGRSPKALKSFLQSIFEKSNLLKSENISFGLWRVYCCCFSCYYAL